MEEHVILLGKKDNPYPYIKACDVYAQPSRYEGKSVTVREAQVLCKPVIVANYTTVKSQIQDGVDGVIVPQDNEGCAQGMAHAAKGKVRHPRHGAQGQIAAEFNAADFHHDPVGVFQRPVPGVEDGIRKTVGIQGEISGNRLKPPGRILAGLSGRSSASTLTPLLANASAT